eukprot:g7364.t1
MRRANSAVSAGFVGSLFAVLLAVAFVLLAVGLRSSAKTNEGESAYVEHGLTLHGSRTNYGTNGDEVAGDQPGPVS